MYQDYLDYFVHTYYYEILTLLPVLLLLSGNLFIVGIDPYIRKNQKRTMLILILLVYGLIAQNYADYLLYSSFRNNLLHRAVISFGYIIRPLILVLLLKIVHPERIITIWEWCLLGINTALYAGSVFWNICYNLNEDNRFLDGIPGLEYTCTVVSLILLGVLLFRTFREFHPVSRKETWLPVFAAGMIPIGLLLDDNVGSILQPVSFLTIVIVIACTLYYSWLHLQFVREHENLLHAEQRIQIMMRQIQPHFLYNTLYTIQALCDTDPDKASEITGKFALYLRQNIDSLNDSARIPFDKEMEHTHIYTDIEKVRFPNIRIEEEIGDRAFTLPPLTIQPLVENAIRHGVRIREEGVIVISTHREEAGHVIVIRDNGKGFDMEKINETDGTHIGVSNVRERIEKICGGSLMIDSRIGEGTTVTIFIPDEADVRLPMTGTGEADLTSGTNKPHSKAAFREDERRKRE